MAEGALQRVFDECLGCLISPVRAGLAAHLATLPHLDHGERDAIALATYEALADILHSKLVRLLILELNVAREEGRLSGATKEARWADFMSHAASPSFWQSVFSAYPSLEQRIDRLIENQVDAARAFVSHWLADQDEIARFLGAEAVRLKAVQFAQGDRHDRGKTVVMVETTAGAIVYKPRSLSVDAALAGFLERLEEGGGELSLRVPEVLDRGAHGWAQHVTHQLAADDEELASFYRGIGEALAIMRVLGGTDLHGENLIAHGGAPVIIDCETLFTPNVAAFASPYGAAHDHASALVRESVLTIGLLPDRAQGLGWRGIDMSGVGGLPDQQPHVMLPGIVDAGTDRAHIGLVPVHVPAKANHPAEAPRLSDFWPEVLAGFDALTACLRQMDVSGELEPALQNFAGCQVRVVVRPTETYAELARMLWHPVSLTDEGAAKERATEVLTAMSANFSYAPSDTAVIASEISDLLVGDVPLFTTTPASGQLDGPGGTCWLPPRDLVASTLSDWRRADDVAEREFIRAALVSAYVNDGYLGNRYPLRASSLRRDQLDVRRRSQAARLMKGLIRSAHFGSDDTVSWVAPVLLPSGWTVQPLGPDLYAGLSGLALAAGAYTCEAAAGRADAVDGAKELYQRLRKTLKLWEAEQRRERVEALDVRPPAMGGFAGLGSQLWTRLTLAQIGMDDDQALADALLIAEGMDWAEAGDDRDDLLYGRAGAIPPLLKLAAMTGEQAPLATAKRLGDVLCAAATRDEQGRAWWPHAQCPDGLGGFAHGSSGIGWALGCLATITRCKRHADFAAAAFAFEDSLWDSGAGNWRDLRGLEGVASSFAWCHGTVGIALARLSLDPELSSSDTARTLDRAVKGTREAGSGWNHCLCHGDFGAWELYDHAIRLGRAPPELDGETLLAELLGSLEEHGPICGVTGDAAPPGLFTGTSGIVYQLLRAHPEAQLPSALMLG